MSDHPPPPRRFRPAPLLGPLGVFMVVIVLLGLGVQLFVSSIPKVPMNPRRAEVEAAAEPVVGVIRAFRARHGAVPRDLPELLAACRDAGLPGDGVLLDPWGRPLLYEPQDPENGGTYIESLGADGKPGGGGENCDVSIWAGNP